MHSQSHQVTSHSLETQKEVLNNLILLSYHQMQVNKYTTALKKLMEPVQDPKEESTQSWVPSNAHLFTPSKPLSVGSLSPALSTIKGQIKLCHPKVLFKQEKLEERGKEAGSDE